MKKKTAFGLILVLVGALFLLNRLELITFGIGDIINTYWPVLLIAFGLATLYRKRRFSGFSLFVIVLGIMFLLKTLEVYDSFDKGLFWPIMIILAGIVILTSRWRFNKEVGNEHGENKENLFDEFVIFSGKDIVNSSQNFLGGTAVAIFGGMDVDLRNASLTENKKAKIEIVAIFGGIDVFIPKDWKIKLTGTPIFGGADNLTENITGDDAKVFIEYTCIFGGCDIKN